MWEFAISNQTQRSRRGEVVKLEPVTIRTVTINAIVQGDRVTPIDRYGNVICKYKRLGDIEGPIDAKAASRWQWMTTVNRIKARLAQRADSRVLDPWLRKTDSLSRSLRLRKRFAPTAPTRKQYFECYSTNTWSKAIERLLQQAHNRMRRSLLSKWDHWSLTVSNNHNKKRK